MVADDAGTSVESNNHSPNLSMAIDERRDMTHPSPQRGDGEPLRNINSVETNIKDKLVCGKCSAEFCLTNLQEYVKHKKDECINSLTPSLVQRIQDASAAAARAAYSSFPRTQGKLFQDLMTNSV